MGVEYRLNLKTEKTLVILMMKKYPKTAPHLLRLLGFSTK
jgi:hypothetical protein